MGTPLESGTTLILWTFLALSVCSSPQQCHHRFEVKTQVGDKPMAKNRNYTLNVCKKEK